MTLQEIKDQYNVHLNGYILDDGKFYGCTQYAPHYWEQFLNGFEDSSFYDPEIPGYVSLFDVSDEERSDFKIEECTKSIALYTDEQGFVYTDEYSYPAYRIAELYGYKEEENVSISF